MQVWIIQVVSYELYDYNILVMQFRQTSHLADRAFLF